MLCFISYIIQGNSQQKKHKKSFAVGQKELELEYEKATRCYQEVCEIERKGRSMKRVKKLLTLLLVVVLVCLVVALVL